jgi:choline-sulfatase
MRLSNLCFGKETAILTGRPNLLYIHSDQHSPHVTGCYGDPLVETPNLDRLAASGVVFDNAYCTSPICVPSRMSMLSGRHPYQNQVWTNEHILDSAIPTLAHSMGAAGYHPVLVGRMHSLGPDQLHGYAERLVGDHSPNHIGSVQQVDRGVLNGTAGPHRISVERSGRGQSAYQVHDEDVVAAAVNYLNRLGVQKRAGMMEEPFSLSVGLMLPHPPYVARSEDYNHYVERMTMPKKPVPFDQVRHPHLRWWRRHTEIEDVTEAEIRRARAAYWGLVHRVDLMVGQILQALAKNDLAEDTLIVYTSDHGDMQGEHGLWWKHVFYEESVRVPLIISWPDMIAAGQRSERMVSALDVTATMLDALGAPALPNSPGRSLLPLIDGRDKIPVWEDEVFSEYCSDQFCPEGGCYQRMIRRDEWKLIYYHEQLPQLFNLKEDPDELVDRADDPACRSLCKELTARVLADWDPEWIRQKMAAKKAEVAVLRGWASNVRPPEQYLWSLKPEMNRLDDWV